MAKGRSPNCPTITLQEALDKGRKVYTEEHTHPADRKVIAEDLGYSGLSGASATLIGALRQYGVLEGRGEGLRISDDAVTAYEMPEGSPERTEAIRRLAFQPALFEELRSQYGDRLPGEANLRHLLIKKGFLPATADDVIRTYRENLELVGSTNQEYNKAEDQPMKSPILDRHEATEAAVFPGRPMDSKQVKPMEISLPVGTAEDGEIVFATVRFSAGIKRNLVASLRALLEAMEKTLPEAT